MHLIVSQLIVNLLIFAANLISLELKTTLNLVESKRIGLACRSLLEAGRLEVLLIIKVATFATFQSLPLVSFAILKLHFPLSDPFIKGEPFVACTFCRELIRRYNRLWLDRGLHEMFLVTVLILQVLEQLFIFQY